MKNKVLKIIICLILFIIAFIVDKLTNFNNIINFFIYLIPYIIISFDSFKEAIENIKEREIFNENLLMLIASFGAMLIVFFPNTDAEFNEAIFVMLFFEVGELFELIAEGKSERSIKSLMDIRPDYANLLVKDEYKKVNPELVKIGDIIVINPGDKVPLDGIIIEGKSSVNTIAITGESIPRMVNEDDFIYSGFVNQSGVLKVKVTKLFEESTASKIIELVKNAGEKKANSEKFITKFSKIYTPIVLVLALLIFIVSSLITGNISVWLYRALTFLVVSCPCALVISVPLAYFGGLGGASKKGILIKGANYLENLSKINSIIFDKTGTLTEGVFLVSAVHPKKISEKELLHIASHVESHSKHPIAVSLIDGYHDNLNDNCVIKNIMEIAGMGAVANVNGEEIYVGNKKLMDSINIKIESECNHFETVVYIASKKEYLGHIVISDKIKKDSKYVIEELNKKNIKTILLTGDNENIAKNVSCQLGIKEYHANLMPVEKVKEAKKLFDNKKIVAFVGDGINDAPVIKICDIGIAMGGIGSDAAIDAADIVLMDDNILSLITAINISKKTNLIAKENIIFAIFIKILVLILSAFGIANMWMAVFADVGVTILAVLNAIRTLKK